MAKKKTSELVCSEGRLYVRSDVSGISPLIQLVGGLRFFTLKRLKKPYFLIEDLIAWYEKEIKDIRACGGKVPDLERKLATIREISERFLSGKFKSEATDA